MVQDSRLELKPKNNDGSLPIMRYDYNVLPKVSENIWHAQKAGWNKILTYDYVSDTVTKNVTKRRKRYENIRKSGVVYSKDSSADEYPFASTVENAGSVWIGNVPGDEQDAQGRLIHSFYSEHGAYTYHARHGRPFWFEVKVVNFPVDLQQTVREGL
jgi:hypothetical protein